VNLFIDEENIDFELENEKNLYEVIKSVNLFLEKNGRHITRIMLNKETNLNLEDEEMLKETPLDNINVLSVFSNTPVGNAVDSLVEIKSYIEKVIHYLENDMDKILSEKKEFVHGLRWIINGTMGAIYTIGLNIDVVFYEEDFLKETLGKLNKLSNDFEDSIIDENAFSILLKKNIKNLLKKLEIFIKIIGIRLYFNLFYAKETDVYSQKTIELFELSIKSLVKLKDDLPNLKQHIVSSGKDKSNYGKKRLILILSTISNDIILAYKVLKFDLSKTPIDDTIMDKYITNLLKRLNDINQSLKNDDISEVKSFI
jgi:hypothetical protein